MGGEEVKVLHMVRAKHAFAAGDESQLGLEVGDVFAVVSKEPSGWWEGLRDGRFGWFPSNFVEVLSSAGVAQAQATAPATIRLSAADTAVLLASLAQREEQEKEQEETQEKEPERPKKLGRRKSQSKMDNKVKSPRKQSFFRKSGQEVKKEKLDPKKEPRKSGEGKRDKELKKSKEPKKSGEAKKEKELKKSGDAKKEDKGLFRKRTKTETKVELSISGPIEVTHKTHVTSEEAGSADKLMEITPRLGLTETTAKRIIWGENQKEEAKRGAVSFGEAKETQEEKKRSTIVVEIDTEELDPVQMETLQIDDVDELADLARNIKLEDEDQEVEEEPSHNRIDMLGSLIEEAEADSQKRNSDFDDEMQSLFKLKKSEDGDEDRDQDSSVVESGSSESEEDMSLRALSALPEKGDDDEAEEDGSMMASKTLDDATTDSIQTSIMQSLQADEEALLKKIGDAEKEAMGEDEKKEEEGEGVEEEADLFDMAKNVNIAALDVYIGALTVENKSQRLKIPARPPPPPPPDSESEGEE